MQRRIESGELDLMEADLWVMLVRTWREPAPSCRTVADVRDIEAKGPGYVPGGKPISGKRIARKGNVLSLDSEDTVWPKTHVTANGIIVYVRGEDLADSDLIGFATYEPPYVVTCGGSFTIRWANSVTYWTDRKGA